MTDNEIVKALECCDVWTDCGKCPRMTPEYPSNIDECRAGLNKTALDLISRQNAEIERLESLSERLGDDIDLKLKYIYELEEKLESAKSEARKECIEKVKILNQNNLILWNEQLDNLLKEMVGDSNE